MKSLYSALILSVFLYLTGCDIATKNPEVNKPKPRGNDLIISEVFTLAPDKYYDYSWIEVYNPNNIMFNWLKVDKPAIGVAVGSNGTVLYTDNSGTDWQSVSSPTQFSLNAVSFSLPDSGVIVGDSGTLMNVKKVGDSWTTRLLSSPDPLRKNLHDIALVDQSTYGILVGDSGLVMRSINRGQAWSNFVKTRVKYNLNSIYIQSFSLLITVGDSGTVLKSAGSSTWTPKPLPEVLVPKTNFYSVRFYDDTIGFVTGQYGTVLKTVNAGETWGYKATNVNSTLRSIFTSREMFFNTNYVWAAGDDGTILKSTDFGDHWNQQTSGVTTTLRKIAFVDSLHGFAFGDAGVILTTTDGGDSWSAQHSNTSSRMLGYFFNYPNIQTVNMYALEMWGVRKHFLSDVILDNPEQTVVNYDYITKVDTGIILFNPTLYISLPSLWSNYIYLKTGSQFTPIPQKLYGIFGPKEISNIGPNAFTVINSDSMKFSNHTKLGPGTVNVVNASIGYLYDSTKPFGIDWFKWNLLPSSEIRLVAYQYKINTATGLYLGYSKKTVDVVRWGNFKPTSWYEEGDSLFTGNEPAGSIPEWYSLSRYANDVGNSDPTKLNTLSSFYMSKDPLPGWYSQKKK
jgi:photosystem II stability/assembly factor-like uncharacterized protein